MDGIHPIRFVKAHPVGTVVCIGLGYYLGTRGIMNVIPGINLRAKAAVSGDGDD